MSYMLSPITKHLTIIPTSLAVRMRKHIVITLSVAHPVSINVIGIITIYANMELNRNAISAPLFEWSAKHDERANV